MGLSSKVIWHQTNFTALKAILTEKRIKCAYSCETISINTRTIIKAFPMISFCDLPISEMIEYLGKSGKYGKYIIGVKREWAIKNGFCPVWYQSPHSNALRSLDGIINDIPADSWEDITEIIKLTWQITSFIKNYQGYLEKYKLKNYRFYDEREIRFVPTYDELISKNYFPTLSIVGYEKYKESHNNLPLLDKIYLELPHDAIEYILVSSSNQKRSIRKLLDIKEIPILSYKQIKEDIMGLCHNQ